jgi:serine acetyltransferase
MSRVLDEPAVRGGEVPNADGHEAVPPGDGSFMPNPLTARVLLFLCRHHVPVLGRLCRLLLHCDIYCDLRHSRIAMPHPFGIVIHSKARIGDRVVVMQQVTIGGHTPGLNEAPEIGDDVYVGAGAKVLGSIRVGRGAIIGANAVVTRDVPAGATVVGANRIVRRAN